MTKVTEMTTKTWMRQTLIGWVTIGTKNSSRYVEKLSNGDINAVSNLFFPIFPIIDDLEFCHSAYDSPLDFVPMKQKNMQNSLQTFYDWFSSWCIRNDNFIYSLLCRFFSFISHISNKKNEKESGKEVWRIPDDIKV